MAKIVIVGAGVMGSAFSLPLSDAGQQVHLVGTHRNLMRNYRKMSFLLHIINWTRLWGMIRI
jgi:ketopantoate reductase